MADDNVIRFPVERTRPPDDRANAPERVAKPPMSYADAKIYLQDHINDHGENDPHLIQAAMDRGDHDKPAWEIQDLGNRLIAKCVFCDEVVHVDKP